MFQLHSMPRRPVHWPEECPVCGLPCGYSAAQQQFLGQNVLHGMRGGSQGFQPSRLQVRLSVHWQGRQALWLHRAGRVSIADIHVPVFGTKGFLTGLYRSPCCRRAGIAQLVESNWKAGTVLMLVQVPRCSTGFFSQSRISGQILLQCTYSIFFAVICISICEHVKKPKYWQLYYCLDTRKCCTHW